MQPGEKFKILIVDDEKPVLQIVEEILQDNGFETVSMSSPLDALTKARRNKFDALVLDVYMPEMSGMLFHAKLRVFDPDLAHRTVFISGYVSRDELRSHLSSAPAFLEKPFKTHQLIEMVQRMLPEHPRSAAIPAVQTPDPS